MASVTKAQFLQLLCANNYQLVNHLLTPSEELTSDVFLGKIFLPVKQCL